MKNNQIKNYLKKSIEGNYFSTNSFVGINNLEEVAEKVLGKGWEAEDDCAQIQAIINHLNIGKYNVTCDDNYTNRNGEDIVVKKVEIIKNQDYYYRIFCMAHIIGIDDNDLDAIWENGTIVYELFLESKFNVDTMHELECMQLFYKEYKARQEFLNSGTYIMTDKRVRDIVHNAIDELKTIDIDGECMEFIIKNLGMEDQMLSQLGHNLIVENHCLKHRLNVISEDERALRKFVIHDEVTTHLNNIEIACDLNDSESLNWINHNKNNRR